MFKAVLIANRGEIAVRIIRACRNLGIRTVAVYSDADRGSLHVRMADSSVRIGEGPARASYLVGSSIIAAAIAEGVEAVHPGYGFLSEDPAFAQAVTGAGLVFVGPSAPVIATMADKTAARLAAEKAGLRTLPGTSKPVTPETASVAAASIGYPLLVKAAFGGGGRGMRIVGDAARLQDAVAEAAREAGLSFGRSDVFLERYLDRPRHVEVQILCDRHGTVLHVGDRDCSMQRRHQKVIEESPAPNLSDPTRAALHEAAVDLASSIGYVGAGTVEFLVDSEENAYFLEMNTRLQVEHGVTELVSGLDLVELQLRIAAGEVLGLRQRDIALRGHAIQARVAAEDASRDFVPSSGSLSRVALPSGPWIRADFGFADGDQVPPHYDSMIGKVLAWGQTRDEASRRLSAALAETRVEGVAHNVSFLRSLVEGEDFAAVRHDVGWIERQPAWTGGSDQVVPAAYPSEKPSAGSFRRAVLNTPQGDVVLDVFSGRTGGNRGIERRLRDAVATSFNDGEKSGPIAPLDSTIVKILVEVGDVVTDKTPLVSVEAMKMEMPVLAGSSGIVKSIHASIGETVRAGTLLVTIEPSD